MVWGTVTVGGIQFRETRVADQSADDLKIVGQESHPPSTRAHVEASHHNVLGLRELVVPAVFTDKRELTGFYRVTDARSVLTDIHQGAHQTVDWSLTLARLGSAADVEIESQVPTVAKPTAVGAPPPAVFWHAPAGGATSYFTGPTVPTTRLERLSADGLIAVYLGIPVGVAPRWTVPADAYQRGAARLLFDGIRRVGTITPPLAVWEVSNGLVRVVSGPAGSVTVSCWEAAGGWRSPKSFAVTVDGAALTAPPELTVLRNDPREVAVRLSYPSTPGRVTVDLSLRRGARFVTAAMKRHSAATLGVTRTAAEPTTAVTGGLRATAADADGNRFVMGSLAAVTATTATASIAKAASTQLDFFLGHEVGAPQGGDGFADLWSQYRGSTGERTRIVSR